MNRFFVSENDIDTNVGEITLTGGNAKHAADVLRLSAGDTCVVCDGAKTDYFCVAEKIAKNVVCLKITETAANPNEPEHRVHLFQSLPKFDKLEHIIQKSVELGVYAIYPVETSRSIVGRKTVSADKLERFNKISEAAAKQSARGIIPKVYQPAALTESISHVKSINPYLKLCAYENEKTYGLKHVLRNTAVQADCDICLFIGPEGGFSEIEIDFLKENGFLTVSLGERVLRCETAGPAALAMILYELEG